MADLLIKNARIINEGQSFKGHLWIQNGVIYKIFTNDIPEEAKKIPFLDAENKTIIPGVIDDQVHFREPGLTHKEDIRSGSRAAVAGGITSFMEMPNTNPQTITQQLLEEKYNIAANKSLANYSFYIGATNDNLDELLKTNPREVCGVKVFMGSSTGNMLVDNIKSLEKIFAETNLLIATHCEDEETITNNLAVFKNKFGDSIPFKCHPEIRSTEACYKSSSLAVELASRYNSRLHILHLSTEKELGLFNHTLSASEKRITGEVCVHHLWFDDSMYDSLGARIKWNPAIKKRSDKKALLQGLLDNKIDVVATDHAPHTVDEKNNPYLKAPSGGPLVQHSLVVMLELFHKGKISLEKVVEKMCHTPALIFGVEKRGYIREGYWADLVILDLNNPWKVEKDNLLYKCGWSPFEGNTFTSKVTHTFVNGNLVYENGRINEDIRGARLRFNR
ncbi:MAG: dihydroorotase [Bacteroidales bacterium]|nr:dihydroorotase [Bacteroidales bacterium]